MNKKFAALALAAALAVGGAVATPIVTAAPAQAASSCKKVWTGKYKRLNTPICWLTPSNPNCLVKVYAVQCGGKF